MRAVAFLKRPPFLFQTKELKTMFATYGTQRSGGMKKALACSKGRPRVFGSAGIGKAGEAPAPSAAGPGTQPENGSGGGQ